MKWLVLLWKCIEEHFAQQKSQVCMLYGPHNTKDPIIFSYPGCQKFLGFMRIAFIAFIGMNGAPSPMLCPDCNCLIHGKKQLWHTGPSKCQVNPQHNHKCNYKPGRVEQMTGYEGKAKIWLQSLPIQYSKHCCKIENTKIKQVAKQ